MLKKRMRPIVSRFTGDFLISFGLEKSKKQRMLTIHTGEKYEFFVVY